MNQKFILFTIVIIVLGIFLFFFSEPQEPGEDLIVTPIPQNQETEPILLEFLVGTFSVDQSYQNEPIEISIQGAKNGKGAQLSWEESQFSVYYLAVLDGEQFQKGQFEEVAFVSGVKEAPAENEEIQQENILGFISSGYVIGDEVQGLHSTAQEGLELTVGKQYYIQLNGLLENDKDITVNKIFTFTSSCLPPNCQ